MRSMSGATAVWIAGAALAAAGEAPTESLRDVACVDTPHAEQHLDFDWPGGKPPATVRFVHGKSLRKSGERRTSPPYRDVCRPFLDAG